MSLTDTRTISNRSSPRKQAGTRRARALRETRKILGCLLLGLLASQFVAAGPALGITLADALDNGTLSFAARGSEPAWSGQTATSHFGGSAAQSASIANAQSTSLVATVTGPGLLRFYWKVSSEANYDVLRVHVDDLDQGGAISGEVNWAQRTIPIASGSHEVRWTYSKDASSSAGSDAAWVDQVEFIAWNPSASVLKLAASDTHTLALRGDGTLWAWGDNASGRLGDGTTQQRAAPVQIGSGTNWRSVSSFYQHSVALKSDGTLWSWGANPYGQLGDGTTTQRSQPGQVGVDTNWAAIAAGADHTLAIKSDGSLWAWGYNGAGQLGDGSATGRLAPARIGTATNWSAVAAGDGHSVAIKSDGSLWLWGYQYSSATFVLWPTQIGTARNWIAIAAGGQYVLALKSDGTLWAWGANPYGQLGDGTSDSRWFPAQVGTASDWTAIDAGYAFALAVKSDGTLWAWGYNYFGQLGDGTNTDRHLPAQVGTASNWWAAAGGGYHAAGLASDGSLWLWGRNSTGQLGDGGNNEAAYLPARVSAGVVHRVAVSVAGNGAVTSSLAGILCGSACAADFTEGQALTLTATPAAGESFLGWGGACSGTGSCALSIDAAKSVTASFSDSTPDAIAFAPALDVAMGQSVTSAAVTIGGIALPAAVSVSGGEYSIGCNGTFTSSAGTIANGDSVCVRHTASSSYGTATETVLTVGLGQGVFRSVTVAAPDTTPDSFSATVLYIPDPDANTVSVVDPAAGAVVGAIKVGLRPVAVVAKADGSRVYVANRGSNTVSVIDTASNRVIAHIASGVEPLSLAASGDDSRLYVGTLGCLGQSWIYVGDTATGTVGRAVPIAFPPYQIAADAAGRYVYAAGVDTGCNIQLAVVDQANAYSVRDDIRLKDGMTMMTTPSEADAREVWGPRGIAVKSDAAGNKVYVSSASGVRVYDAATDAVSTIESGRNLYGAALSPDASRLYVVEKATDKLLSIDTASDAVAAEVAVLDQPSHVALNADGSRIYVLSFATGIVETRDALNGFALLSSVSGITAKADLNGSFAATLRSGFVPKAAGAPGAETVSNWITVSGVNRPVNVTLDAGWYRINDEAQWTAAGAQRQVNNGDRIQVKLAAAAEADAALAATLEVGGVAAPFWVTTAFAGVEVAPMLPPKFTVHSSSALDSIQISKDVNMADYVPAGASVPFAIIGGKYSRNGGPFSVAPGFTSSTDKFVLQALAPAANGVVQSVLLIVNGKTLVSYVEGGTPAAFTVTSVLPDQQVKADTEPDAFAFTPVFDAAPDQPQTSNAITVSGLDSENLAAAQGGKLRAPVSVANGRYKINAGAFRADDYFVENGDTVVVEHTPTGGTTRAELTIGTRPPVPFEVTTVSVATTTTTSTTSTTSSTSTSTTTTAALPTTTVPTTTTSATTSTTTSSTSTSTASATTTTLPDASANLVVGWNLLGNGMSDAIAVSSLFGDANQVNTVWKWIATGGSGWAFYAPALPDGGAAYAQSKGYSLLSTINPGEGFWVNAKSAFSIGLSGNPVASAVFADGGPAGNALPQGWSLIAVGDNKTPAEFANAIAANPPANGQVATSVNTLWAWDAGLASWYFYAPSLVNAGTQAGYIAGKAYLDFGAANKLLTPTTGFWVNHP